MDPVSAARDSDGGGRIAPHRRWILAAAACFCVSGATGLAYEVIWVRMMGLVFGHTVYALTTVVAAFMAGLALGSYTLGCLADRVGRPLRLYASLEIGVALACAAVPWLLEIAGRIYGTLGGSWALSYAAFSGVQAVLVFIVLVIPTTLMGGTLPAMTRFVVRSPAAVRVAVARLYAVNTFGAVLGTALAGLWLLPALGMRTTAWIAVAVNLAIGLVAWLLDRRLPAAARPSLPAAETPGAAGPAAPPAVTSPLSRPAVAALLVTVAVSGAAAMVNQLGWTRALSLMIGSSTYAFTAILLAFLMGIAGGSYLVGRIAPRARLGFAALGLIQMGIGALGLGMMVAFEWLPEAFLRGFHLSTDPRFLLAVQILLSLAIVLGPTLLMGATFPCALHLAAGGPERLGRDVGRVYGANTLGAILGTALGGFFLIPGIGIQGALVTAALANAAVALLLVFASGARGWPLGRWLVAAGVLAVAVGAWKVPPWDRRILTSGPAVYAAIYEPWAERGAFRDIARSQDLLFYEDGPGGTVSVHRDGRSLALRINGKTDASNGVGDMRTQLLAGHLPLLFHPAPQNVFVLGLGSGVTAGAVLAHPIQRVEVVEIEPAVVRAARLFARENRGALDDPRTRLVVADARHRLATASERFDAIILEPSNPWIRGLATLFTREFYGIVRDRVRPGGLVLQWVQGYGLAPGDFAMILRTFRQAFPHATLWYTAGGDFLLLGGSAPYRMDLPRARRRMEASPGLREDFALLGLRSPTALLADFLLGERDTARFAGRGPQNTDDLLALEYSAPLSLYRDTVGENLAALRRARTEGPAGLVAEAQALEAPQARYEVALALIAKRAPGEALGHLETALRLDPHFAPARLERGRTLLALGQPARALADLELAARGPDRYEALTLLGQAHADLGDLTAAERSWRAALALRADAGPHVALGSVYARRGRAADALEEFRTALRLAPQDAEALWRAGAALLTLGRAAEAIQPLLAATRANNRDPRAFLALGQAYAATGDARAAEAALRVALSLDPGSVPVYLELSAVYAAEGALEPAIATLERGLRARPGDPAITARRAALLARRTGPRP